MLLLTFSRKKLFIFIFSLFFKIMLENPAPPPLKVSSPMKSSSIWRSSHVTPLQPPPQTKKIPLKTSVHFPVTITICKHRSKFVTCSPSHGDCGGLSRPQRIVIRLFLATMVNKMAISEFWSGDFWEKMSVGGGLFALQIFWSLKKALELLISVRMSPFATF